MRVLLADPDCVFMEIAESYLCRFGYEVEIANDGLDCIASLRDFAPDALVMDQELLWGGSQGICELMADEQLLSNITIILTGEGRNYEESPAQSGLPFDCLAKPYRLAELLAHLDDAMGTKSKLLAPAEAR